VPEPDIPELQRLTRAMNAMVGRLKLIFDSQARQVDAIRRQATCDPLTGVANRAHFLAQLQADLQRDDGPAQVSLVLLRLGDLAGLNQSLGHTATDRLIKAVADTLNDYAENVRGSLLGRLNGSDFAVSLPVGGVSHESGLAIAQALQVVVPTLAPGASVAVGVVEIARSTAADGLGRVLGLADAALAQAEAREPFSVRAVDVQTGDLGGLAARGEGAWRSHIAGALAESSRMRLAAYPVIDRAGRLLHLECPLRMQLEADGGFEPAAFWLPLALRSRSTARIDERAVAIALADVARDGLDRCVNLSHASLADPGFVERLRQLLADRPRAARSLWLELPESVALDHFGRLQHIARELRPLGVRLGLEHAGNRLHAVPTLYEAGLDYVKLDSAMGHGVSDDSPRADLVRALVTLLHGLAVQVFVEGVRSREDADVLWACEVDGITGPWVPARDTA
jgi:diguanylate cyclase (GGDEF)-like protein